VCDQVRVPVLHGETSIPDARHIVDAWCDRWAMGTAAREELRLLASELATNALVHGWPPIELTLSLTGSWAEVSVRDASPCRPVVRPPRRDLLADLDVVAARTDGLPEVCLSL
jgi:anti-sigma regulatory factor (Ser/Thr protein kinase)